MKEKEPIKLGSISTKSTEKPLESSEASHKNTLAQDKNTKDGITNQNGILTLKHALLQEFLKKYAQLNSRWNSSILSTKKQRLNGLLLTKLIKKAGMV